MAGYGLPFSQKKNQKPQTKTHHNKTINSREADTPKRVLLPAFTILVAGFFIASLFSLGQANSQLSSDEQELTDSSVSVLSDKATQDNQDATNNENESSDSDIKNSSDISIKDKSSNSVSINASVSVKSSSTGENTSSSETTPKVSLNGEEVTLPKNGIVRSDCKTEDTRIRTRIRVQNDSNAEINIDTPGGCNE